MRTKLFSILTVLLMAATGAWAQTPIKSTGVVKSKTATTKEAASQHSGDVRVAVGVVNSKAAPKRAAGLKRAPKAGYASVTLTAGDVWGDGSGYQMLLDADATAYGSIIPETGGLTSSGDASPVVYAEFEYKIPENADGSRSTQNIVINNSITIEIPAGTYDWCITNPTPGDRVWIASDNGNVGGRQDDFVFEDGATYVFTVSLADNGYNDKVDLEAIFPWTATLPTELTAAPDATSAEVSWVPGENNDAWNLRYREYVDIDPVETNRLIDLPVDGYEEQLEGIIFIDNDGDGNNWELVYTSSAQVNACFYSASYDNGTVYTPDNWLLFPAKLGGTFKFKVSSHHEYYPDTFGVFVVDHQDFTSVDEFVQVGNDLDSGEEDWHEVEYDLSAFSGLGYVAIRHYNCTDQYGIYVDDVEIIVPDPKTPNEWIEEDNVTNPYTIEGLKPETTYEVQVMAYNDRDATDWSESFNFTTLNLTLDETEDNTAWLTENDGEVCSIILGRTLQTGSYNTFAAPFGISSEKLTELGITAKQLTGSAFDSETGVLTLDFADASGIEAGKPYLVKVSGNVENPLFEGVTVSGAVVPTVTEAADFIPTLGKTRIEGDVKSILFVGAGNTLYYPTELPADMKGFRAYFQLKGEAASQARSFTLNFGDDVATGIISLTADGAAKADAATYTLDGRRIESRPTLKGVYIVNGKKSVIK